MAFVENRPFSIFSNVIQWKLEMKKNLRIQIIAIFTSNYYLRGPNFELIEIFFFYLY